MYELKLQHMNVQQLKWKINGLLKLWYFYFPVDLIDENQMVFIDNSNSDDSIELVNHSMESSSELSTERKDIVEVNNVVALSFKPFQSFVKLNFYWGIFWENFTSKMYPYVPVNFM